MDRDMQFKPVRGTFYSEDGVPVLYVDNIYSIEVLKDLKYSDDIKKDMVINIKCNSIKLF